MRHRFEDCLIDTGTRELFRENQRIHLSPKAFQLLLLLLESRPNAVSKDDIHKALWPDSFVADGNLANLVSELREGLGDDAANPRIIRTVPRFGYSFPASVEPLEAAAVSPEPAPPGSCRLLWGDRELHLGEGENLIGRDENAAVRIDDASVSRYHARILIEGFVAKLEDLGSKNGTHLGDRRLTGAVALRDGDAIRLGSVLLTFRRPGTGEATETASIR